jgi:DNA processing protein
VSTFPETPVTARLTRDDARYPRDLDALQENAPALLWARGALAILEVRPRVAIVGTRRATAYGRRVTHAIASGLARAGACVVSGMARGIDSYAHMAALEVGGATIAVLGTGLDAVYPAGARELQRSIVQRGLLLSELDPPEHGSRFTFPKRNRIIAALADLTIVVEAGVPSGALITADHALDIGRTLAAVPGPIDQPQSVGANRLIQQGAHPITAVEDALALVGLTPAPRVPRGDESGDEARVWRALANGPLDMEELCHRSGLPAAQCMVAVSTLEIAGSVECALTGQIRRR